MAPLVIKPENALRRAEDLMNVGQSLAALQSLHEMLTSKRYRNFTEAHEPMTLKLLELCVELRKGKIAKDSLVAYRNLTQTVNVPSLEMVVMKYLAMAEGKVISAQAKADKITLDYIEDLEASETPESIMLSTVSNQDNKDRTDRELVTPWLKLLWEAYRTILDVLRNNNKLESLYQTVANRAFDFCLKYHRKVELRRLCELLRNHLLTSSKYSHQAHSVNLSSPESLQMHLQTRFVQLNASAQLEQWQEAFRSIEDINGLTLLARQPLHPAMWVDFYEKLTRIFFVSRDFLFHAASYNKYFFAYSRLPKSAEKTVSNLASLMLLSALAVPLSAGKQASAFDESQMRFVRLTQLLHMKATPTRESLIREALNSSLLPLVVPEVKAIHDLLEINFDAMTATEQFEPLMQKLAKNSEMQRYIKPLYRVLLTRVLQQISQKFRSIKLDKVFELCTFPAPFAMNKFEIERFMLQGCKRGEFSFRIDRLNNTLTSDPLQLLPKEKTGYIVSSPAEQFRIHMSQVADRLYTAMDILDPSLVEMRQKQRKEFRDKVIKNVEKERQALLARKEMIEQKKEQIEALLAKKERLESQERTLRAQQEAEAEKKRLAEESHRREVERLQQEREEIERQQAIQLAEELKKKNLNIKIDDVENLDKGKLLQLQVEQLEKQKRELQERLTGLAKRIDHTERAYRLEEIPLISSSYQKQKELDRENFENAYQLSLEASKRQFTQDAESKKRLNRIMEEVKAYRDNLLEIHHAELEVKRAAATKKIEAEKQKRIAEFKAKRKQEIEKKKREEEAAAAKAEAERLENEAQEKIQAEKRARLLKLKEEREMQMAEANNQARRQREREEEAEQNRRRRAAEREAARGGDRGARETEPELDWTTVSRARAANGEKTEQSKPAVWRPRFKQQEAPPDRIASGESGSPASRSDTQRYEPETGERFSSQKPAAYVPPSRRNQTQNSGSPNTGSWRRQ